MDFSHQTCRYCGKVFETNNKQAARYCCQAHRQAAYRERHANEDKSAWCIWCGKRFWPERGGAKFCCSAHKQAAYRLRAKRGGQLMLGE